MRPRRVRDGWKTKVLEARIGVLEGLLGLVQSALFQEGAAEDELRSADLVEKVDPSVEELSAWRASASASSSRRLEMDCGEGRVACAASAMLSASRAVEKDFRCSIASSGLPSMK